MTNIDRVVYLARHQFSESGRVGYVGISRCGLSVRKARHLRDAARNKFDTPFHRALRKYPAEAWEWTVVENGFSSDEELKAAEIRWIARLRTREVGYNATRGGDGVVNPSSEVRAKLSASLKGRPSPRRGQLLSEDTKEKLRRANTGKRLTKECKKKIGDFFRGKKLTEEHRTKVSRTRIERHIPSPTKGKPRSPETREKIGAAQRGPKNHMFGKQTWITGKKHTEETRAKMQAAWLRRKERLKHE